MWQGLALSAFLTVGGYGLKLLPGLNESGFSPLVLALALGLIVGNLPGFGRAAATARPGLQFATRWLLRSGIVLFGLSLTLQQIVALGPSVLVLDLLVVSSVLLVGYQLGTRVFGLDRETTLLTCAGSAICGAAAVLATETIIRARPASTSMAVTTVVLFGSLAMVIYPLLYPLVGLNEDMFGIYIGATVHEVAQVVAAGDAVGPTALANAVIVKLVRVMLLVPFLLVVGQCWMRRNSKARNQERGRLVVPWFALGFVMMVGLNSVAVIPGTLHQGLVLVGQIALTMAMAALGYETRLDKLASLGAKPVALAMCLFILLTAGGLLSVSLMSRV